MVAAARGFGMVGIAQNQGGLRQECVGMILGF